MARQPRLDLPGIPQHVIQRGNNRRPCFLDDADLTAIRTYLQQQRALGRDAFRAIVEARTRRFAGVRPAHRPPRVTNPTGSEPDPVLHRE